ncbi:MAG: hypothetical protein Tsb0021_08940 [Chlamydiales bacterium]
MEVPNVVRNVAGKMHRVADRLNGASSYLLPRSIPIGAAGFFVTWYGHKILLVELTIYFKNKAVEQTTKKIGNASLAWFLVTFGISPFTIPTAVPILAKVIGTGLGYVTVLFLNIVFYGREKPQETPQSATLTEQPV